MINERLDVVVWASVLLLFVLLGARAWAVETSGAKLYRTSTRVRALTIASWLAGAAMVGLLAVQGGVILTQSILNRSDPSLTTTVIPADPNEP
ncbi:MAG: hypothetical protein ACRDQ0_21275, partial [Pseudonocardia sp.]